MSKVYILQKMTDGIANVHYVNVKVIVETDEINKNKLKNLIVHCVSKLNLKPLNWNFNVPKVDAMKMFLNCEMQLFGSLGSLGVKTDKVMSQYRIMHMDAD